jgi:hypothetical protein
MKLNSYALRVLPLCFHSRRWTLPWENSTIGDLDER